MFKLIYFSLIVKHAYFVYVINTQIRSWNQPEGKDSCSRKQQEPVMWLELTPKQLQVRLSTPAPRHSLTPQDLYTDIRYAFTNTAKTFNTTYLIRLKHTNIQMVISQILQLHAFSFILIC